jgi:hypothetical protein
MITRVSSVTVYGPKGSVIFDHPYNAEYALLAHQMPESPTAAQINHSSVLPGIHRAL